MFPVSIDISSGVLGCADRARNTVELVQLSMPFPRILSQICFLKFAIFGSLAFAKKVSNVSKCYSSAKRLFSYHRYMALGFNQAGQIRLGSRRELKHSFVRVVNWIHQKIGRIQDIENVDWEDLLLGIKMRFFRKVWYFYKNFSVLRIHVHFYVDSSNTD